MEHDNNHKSKPVSPPGSHLSCVYHCASAVTDSLYQPQFSRKIENIWFLRLSCKATIIGLIHEYIRSPSEVTHLKNSRIKILNSEGSQNYVLYVRGFEAPKISGILETDIQVGNMHFFGSLHNKNRILRNQLSSVSAALTVTLVSLQNQ